ncbi:unnamed protein product [Linum trigynum]|uniref:Uncharacterized protein n=1 Tax=Linum trigynum TaxID=586398 RepID=A0AAV2GBE3_9ROSI
MLENPTPAATPADSSATVKRYAPPNQRNRSLNRRKSGDRIDRFSSFYGNDGDKILTHTSSRNILGVDRGDAVIQTLQNENSQRALVALEGCCHSDASQLLNDRKFYMRPIE